MPRQKIVKKSRTTLISWCTFTVDLRSPLAAAWDTENFGFSGCHPKLCRYLEWDAHLLGGSGIWALGSGVLALGFCLWKPKVTQVCRADRLCG